jgi:protein SCO1/2
MSVSSTLTPEKAMPDNAGPEQISPQQPKRFSFKHGAWLWIALALIPIVAVLAFAILQPVKVRPRMGLAPGYVFTDTKGGEVTSEDMRGKLVFYNFTYAGCGDGCPQTTKTMAEIQKLVRGLDTGGLPVEFVTISFDPDRDTPQRLDTLAASVGADTSNWRFVTGPAERLKNVIGGGFSVFYQPDGAGGFTFDPTIVMVDGNGIVRGVYERTMPDMTTVARDVGLLATEVKNSTGPGKLVYEAAHLFLCYPKS